MAYAALLANQGVNFNDLQDAVNTNVFYPTLTNVIPVSTQIVQKSQIVLYVYINQSNSFYAAKPVNENIDKQDLTPITPTANAVNLSYGATMGDVCSVTPIPFYVVAPITDIAVGVVIYLDSALTIPSTYPYMGLGGAGDPIYTLNGAGLVTALEGTSC